MTEPAPVQNLPSFVGDIPIQPASADIWDKKYRLKTKDGTILDETVDQTYQRIARAIAEVENKDVQEYWYEQFLWALRHGAIPAGRITSNAGAWDHKPATSTINCTVSSTIGDSMDDILDKVHEAGLTLKAGCGIGYEFSTLRPKGAYVTGAGAYTSGPLSFMDIYDKMCFTVSSAGGRRGAQMATFDVGHPDVLDFIRAKREDGRLRQFNLSLLIHDEFMAAVRNGDNWKLAFPLTEKERDTDAIDVNDPEQVVWRDWPRRQGYITRDDGLVACRVYKTLKAQRLWDMIMTSTYDYAEPGFILIDRVNQMNNNWFCEEIRATNPCVTADTWVQTDAGPRQVSELIGQPFQAVVDGEAHTSGEDGFFQTATKPVVRLNTAEGYSLRLTEDHQVRRVARFTRAATETEWCAASELRAGDRVLLNNHREQAEWQGALNEDEGYLLGLLVGDGTLKSDKAVLSAWAPAAVVNGEGSEPAPGVQAVMARAESAARGLGHRADFGGWQSVGDRPEWRLSTAALKQLAEDYGMSAGDKGLTEAVERSSSAGHKGVLRGLFDADGSVQGTQAKGVSVRLAQSDLGRLQTAQRMLLRLGITATLYRDRRANSQEATLPDGQGGHADYAIQPQHELVITGEDLHYFADRIGFEDTDKQARLDSALAGYKRAMNRTRFTARVTGIEADGEEAVYDVQVPGINTFDANGVHVHNCGEQPLPPYGACLLGSVNLTKFVREPFTERAWFDWDEYRKVVDIFTRMLDNVVEINGLPLDKQQNEIQRKRRHGMGFLGLGSTVTMLRMKYGQADSLEFTEEASKQMALQGWRTALDLAEEKGAAPVMDEEYKVTEEMLRLRPEMKQDGYKVGNKVPGRVLWAKYSHYMQRIAEEEPELVDKLATQGARFTHHSSIAPTGTISLSLANNASNGIEPSFAHHYYRNVIREGRKTKEKVPVYSFELLAYRHFIDEEAVPSDDPATQNLPDYFISAEDVTPMQHVAIQAAAQRWVDSSISKTANVPTEYAYDDFKDIYLYAYQQGLKGCTTFRFNPEVFQGVLVKGDDLANTTYRFKLEDGTTVEAKGDEEIEYDGEMHTAANLYDALKEGYYGKF